MTNDQINPNSPSPKIVFDLEERTAIFSQKVIDYVKKISQNNITSPLINQLVRSVTSIGANYCEADEASSKKDFINKLCIAKKEAKETKYWLRLIAHIAPQFIDEARVHWREAQELNLILAAIIRNTKNKAE